MTGKEKSHNKNHFLINIKHVLKNGAWVLLTALGIESFTYKLPYFIVLGVMLILIGLLFFPWLDKLCNLLNIKLNSKNKWFILVGSIIISAYLITPNEKKYSRCILPIILMFVLWIGVILYKKLFIKVSDNHESKN